MTPFLFLRIKRLRTKNEMSWTQWTQVGKETGKKKKKHVGGMCISDTEGKKRRKNNVRMLVGA